MKSQGIILLTALAAGSVLAQGLSQQSVPIYDGAIVSPLTRTTLFVRDIDESLKLYRDILGLQPRRPEMTLEGPFWSEAIGAAGENKVQRVVVLNTTGPGGEMVGNIWLFQFIDENAGPPVYKPARLQTGDMALVMVTQNIHDIYEKVKAAGYTIITPPMSPKPQDVPGMDPGMLAELYEMLFFDRDGIAINLIQSPGNGA